MDIGQRLGAYEVTGTLGAGGMGEVYRARDTRLNRDVALKILPDKFAADPDRLARFEREAQALAALNHSNIAQVYGLEGRAIAMELVEGDDLAARLARGPMPLDEALPVARQVALALEVAHGAGIVHRDLKPANVKIRPDGAVKVLDFGLAKVRSNDGHSSAATLANSPTVAAPATELGVLLGTAAYMSPEQAKGRAVDRRTDVWAFGVMVYEMRTGRRAFAGGDVTEVLAAVIRDTPDLSALPAGTPPAIRRLLRRCLERDLQRRLRDMGDVGVELDDILSSPGSDESGDAGAAIAPPPRRSPLLVVAAAAFFAAIGAAAAWPFKPAPPVERPITRFTITLDPGEAIDVSQAFPGLALSPDGRRLAYRVVPGSIYVRDLDRLDTRQVAGPDGGSGLWFSSDGEWLLFGTMRGLSKVPVAGGPEQGIVGEVTVPGAEWGDSGTVLFATGEGIHGVPHTGGAPRLIVQAAQGATTAFPQLLSGGTSILYTKYDGAFSTQLAPLDGGPSEVVLQGFGAVRYLETGHLLYGLDNRLFAVPFDLASRTVTGPAVQMPEAVEVGRLSGLAQAVASRTGTLAYVTPGEAQASMRLLWVDATGTAAPALGVSRVYSDLRLSPDGRRAALHLFDEENDVWVADLARGGLMRMTFTPGEDETPVWSPDGRHLAYAGVREREPRGLFRKLVDASASAGEERIWQTSDHFHVNDWSPDGRTVLVEVRRSETSNDILAIDVETRQETPILQTRYSEGSGRFSPDGQWLACVSEESGRGEVYVQPYPALDRRVPVSTSGGTEPVWSRDGRRLFFRSADSVMAASVVSVSPLEFSKPEVLFADAYARTQSYPHTHFDTAPDGRFLLIESGAGVGQQERQRIQVVINWTEELKRLAPAR